MYKKVFVILCVLSTAIFGQKSGDLVEGIGPISIESTTFDDNTEMLKALKIVIPSFKIEGTLEDVLKKLKADSKIHDPAKKGVLIILRAFENSSVVPAVESSDLDDPFGPDPAEEDDPFAVNLADSSKKEAPIEAKLFAFEFTNMPVKDIIRYVCISSNMKFKVDTHAVIIADVRISHCGLDTIFIPVKESTVTLLKQYAAEEVDESSVERGDLEPYLESFGVLFPAGAQAAYLPKVGRLVVTNEYIYNERLKSVMRLLENELSYKPRFASSRIKEPKVLTQLKTVLPKIRLEDQSLGAALNFLKQQTKKNPLNIIVDNEGEITNLINLDADNMPVGEFIKYICDQLKLTYMIEENALIIGDHKKYQVLKTALYDIPDELVEIIGKKKDVVYWKYFDKLGLSFPPGARIKTLYNHQKLLMINTSDNHIALENILKNVKGLFRSNELQIVLKRVIPRFKYSGSMRDVFKALKEETISSDPDVPSLSIVYRSKIDKKKQVLLDLENMPLGEILRTLCIVHNLKYQVDSYAVVISDASVAPLARSVEDKMRQLQQNFIRLQTELNELKKQMIDENKEIVKVERLKNRPIEKLLKVIIPKTRFENRDILFVVDFLNRTTRDLSENGEGLNIILGDVNKKKTINLDLDDVPAGEILRYACDQLGMSIAIEDYAVIIREKKAR